MEILWQKLSPCRDRYAQKLEPRGTKERPKERLAVENDYVEKSGMCRGAGEVPSTPYVSRVSFFSMPRPR